MGFFKDNNNKYIIGGIAVIVMLAIVILIASNKEKEKESGSGASETNVAANEAETDMSADEVDFSQYVTLGQYTGLAILTTKGEPSDEDIGNAFDEVLDSYGGYYDEDPEGIVDDGDNVTVGYMPAETEETAFNENLAQGLTVIIGNDDNIPEEFYTPLIGHKINDTVFVTLSDGGTYLVRIEHVHQKATPPDDYIKGLGIEGADTVQGLKELIHDYLDRVYQSNYEDEAKEELIGSAYNNCKFNEIPEEYVRPFKEALKSTLDDMVKQSKESEGGEELTYDDILKEVYERDEINTVDEYLELYGLQNARIYAMCKAIAAKENIDTKGLVLYSLAATDWAENTAVYPTLKDYVEDKGTDDYERAATLVAVRDYLYDNAIK